MEVWQTILLAMGGNVALLAVLGWLSRSLVGQLLAKDLESFKSTLRSESEIASQNLRHELEKASIEHQIRFSKLHEKRAEVIAEIYSLLVQAQWDLSSFVSTIERGGEPNKKEKYVTAMNSAADFYRFFEKNKIYLPEKLCSQIDDFVMAMRKKAIKFGVYVQYDEHQIPDESISKKIDAWIAASDYFEQNVPKAKAALENELRAILGGIS